MNLSTATIAYWTQLPAIDPVAIPGVSDGVNVVMGWFLFIVSILSLIGLLAVCVIGFESYRHNQGEKFIQGAKMWLLGALLAQSAAQIIQIFIPGFRLTATATAIPGLTGPVHDILGNIVWGIGWLAFACLIFLAIRGLIAYRDGAAAEFISKFSWFIVGIVGVSLVTQIAGVFFPAVLTFA